jgi:hypothetical protein
MIASLKKRINRKTLLKGKINHKGAKYTKKDKEK